MNGKFLPPGALRPRPATGDAAAGPAPETGRTLAQPRMRHVHRRRDFGVGYGNSSGYDDGRHYGDGHVDPMFRCV